MLIHAVELIWVGQAGVQIGEMVVSNPLCRATLHPREFSATVFKPSFSLMYYEDSTSTHTFGGLRPLNTSQPLSSWLIEKEGIILLTQCCHNQQETNTLQQRGEARCLGTSGCGSLKLIWQRKTTVNLNFSLLPFTWA